MPVVCFLLETAAGAVEMRPCKTRTEALLLVGRAIETRADSVRLTIAEDGRPVYSTRRTPEGWREDPIG